MDFLEIPIDNFKLLFMVAQVWELRFENTDLGTKEDEVSMEPERTDKDHKKTRTNERKKIVSHAENSDKTNPAIKV